MADKEKKQKKNLERTKEELKKYEKLVCEEDIEKCKSDIVSIWRREEDVISDVFLDEVAGGNPYESPPVCIFIPSVSISKWGSG
ncbi:hypothetical protein KO507_16525 [Gilvimarinus agarilyticus]|uniref:hypothetical protein n=1 Tax=Gilvimarinus sp. 2_MG-2023 TaxID=3062666 RepID=UPI001C09EFA9|nr:hypothetical protein [Gilvimarinus sp. 2_MG-2023]MBU2887372.1 hypothetical protein [Gilvimarinus agarilyticus]MDO6572031.1 hypothetical protein [Gilvimarinus sp. 2_MG-2023]